MEKVLEKAKELAQLILASKEYTDMHNAEEIAMHDEKVNLLLGSYAEKRKKVEDLLASPDLDKGDLAKAGEELENVENAIAENELLNRVRDTNDAFAAMMKKVNGIIQYEVTGEMPHEEHEGGCNGDCHSCHGECGHQH